MKILTGDNEKVTKCVCRHVGLAAEKMLLGSEVEAMSNEELAAAAEYTTVFGQIGAAQKARSSTPAA